MARLHTEYESVDPWAKLTYTYAPGFDAGHADAYRVLKMKHPKIVNPIDPDGGKVDDLSRIIYNDWITIGEIPERAYSYELGSRSAIAWVIESNRVKTDKASGGPQRPERLGDRARRPDLHPRPRRAHRDGVYADARHRRSASEAGPGAARERGFDGR